MSHDPRPETKQALPKALIHQLWAVFKRNWKLKLLSLLFGITIWGALISEDATLTREKTFVDVPVSIIGTEALQRNGLVVVAGLDKLPLLRVRVEVPQKVYDSATPAMYSVRADVSRITGVGEQTIPIQTSGTATYGAVEWMSANEIKVTVDEYITRRRVPVRLAPTGLIPEGFYSASVSADPAQVVISGPRSLVDRIASVTAYYNQGAITAQAGIQYSAVPFRLLAGDGTEIVSNLISVTSENVLLDTLLVEQSIYPVKQVPVNLSGITKGLVLEGYEIASVKADPETIRIAGNPQDIDSITMLDLTTAIDVSALSEPVIRALRVDKPAGVVYLSENAVYVTVNILPKAVAEGD